MTESAKPLGAFFTPENWAHFAIRRYKLYDKCLKGQNILDPTMGDAALLTALLSYSSRKQVDPGRLYGIETDPVFYAKALQNIEGAARKKVDSSQFLQTDFLFQQPDFKADIIFGNPPWLNYNNIPDTYQKIVRPLFVEYGLAIHNRSLLLGGSRIELAGLFVLKAIQHHLKDGGEAVFFLPLSLFHNEGANRYFRSFKAGNTPFKVEEIIDLTQAKVFPNVGTHYGLVHFRKGSETQFPIPYFRFEGGRLVAMKAEPLHGEGSPLCVLGKRNHSPVKNFKPIAIRKDSVPRQGINTCGANDVYFFGKEDLIAGLEPFMYPLITKENFRKDESEMIYRSVLLPYHKTGFLLKPEEIQHFTELNNYLESHYQKLSQRKGKMIQALMKRNGWYSLLGMGPYSFFPWKIVWEAYGRDHFDPKIFPGHWQANQALQGFIPCKSLREAESILKRLKEPSVQAYLSCHSMDGTMNWAQPGKIRKLLTLLD